MEFKLDDFSGYIFGAERQLKVLGWYCKNKARAKKYLVECSICKEDSELYGDGTFSTEKGSILKGKIPCGCSESFHPNEEQFLLLCKRAVEGRDEDWSKFLGLVGEYKNRNTKLKFMCKQHGKWTTTLYNYKARNADCPKCSRRIPDEIFSARCKDTGAFPEGTQFKRAHKEGVLFPESYYEVYCPICEEVNLSKRGNLLNGHVPCRCSLDRDLYCYIKYISTDTELIGVKFGISCNPKRRLSQISRKTSLVLSTDSVWSFPNTTSAKEAERMCCLSLETGVISKDILPEGFTETTYIINKEAIEKIYESFGGVRLDDV